MGEQGFLHQIVADSNIEVITPEDYQKPKAQEDKRLLLPVEMVARHKDLFFFHVSSIDSMQMMARTELGMEGKYHEEDDFTLMERPWSETLILAEKKFRVKDQEISISLDGVRVKHLSGKRTRKSLALIRMKVTGGRPGYAGLRSHLLLLLPPRVVAHCSSYHCEAHIHFTGACPGCCAGKRRDTRPSAEATGARATRSPKRRCGRSGNLPRR